MCDDEETTRKMTDKCVNNCDGYCSSGNLIPEKIILQYRSLKYKYDDTLITYYFCKRHYEWMLTINNGKPLSYVQGKDEYDALECFCHTDKYEYVSGRSNIFTFLKEKENDDSSNKYNRKVILINECIEKLKLDEKYEVKGVFYFDGDHFIELVPLSYELQDFFKQEDFCYFKLNAEENRMHRIQFHTDKQDGSNSDNNDSNDSNDCNDSNDSNDSNNDCDKKHKQYRETLYSFLEKRNNFEQMYCFVKDTMSELNRFYELNKTTLLNDETKEYTFRHMLMLECALANPDNTINLLTMMKSGQITNELLWLTYVKHNHYSNHTNSIKLKDNKMLISLIIDRFSKDELKLFLQYAIEGCRTYITYRLRDFYNYIHPNLTVVKMIVPKHIHYLDNILCDFQTEDEKDEKKELINTLMKNKMLIFWKESCNYTMSFYPDRGEENHYYDKDENIRYYLESLGK